MATFTEEEVAEFKTTFLQFDTDGNGHVTTGELGEVFKSLGENVPGYKLRDMIAEVDANNSKTVEFPEFIEMMAKVRESGGKVVSAFAKAVKKVEKIKKTGGTSYASTEGTVHSEAEEECFGFADWINSCLAADADVADIVPIDTENDENLFKALKNGVVLCKLINISVPDTIDERTINKTKLNSFKIAENHTLVCNSAAAIGCNIVNIGPSDLSAGVHHLVLGLVWQIIRIGLLSKVNVAQSPEMASVMAGMLQEGEDVEELLTLAPDEMLLRWVNFHLANSGTPRRIANFSGDVNDSEAYIFLLAQIAPEEAGLNTNAMGMMDLEQRAEAMLESADKIGCRKFVRAKDVVAGNSKLNLAFVANLFNMYPALDEASVARGSKGNLGDFDLNSIEETREERTFRNWMNSLGVKPFVHNLYTDLVNGIILLQLFDQIRPGVVDWAKVNMPPFKKLGSNMKKIENNNYAVDIAKTDLKFSMVGIEGKDLFDGVRTLTLAVLWQAMRAYTVAILQRISESDAPITDAQIVEFVNTKLKDGKKTSSIRSFKDDSISSATPVVDLVDAIKPGSVDYSVLSSGTTKADKLSNAKYAISMSRKIGAGVYALPEDIVEVKPKMVMTIFACLMARAYTKKQK